MATLVTFSKRTVYHSELREKTEVEPLVVQFTGTLRQSKYKGKPPYIEFRVDGDETAYQYNAENDAVAEQLRGVEIGPWFRLSATGAKETAALEVRPQAGEQTSVSAAAASGRGGAGEPEPDRSLARVMVEAITTVEEVARVLEERQRIQLSPEDRRAWGISLFIEHNRSGRAFRRPS